MPEEIIWESKLGIAIERARKGNKLVLAAFFSQDCGPCNNMKKHTLSTERVIEYINHYFIPIKYESGTDSEQFLRFDISAMPTMIVLDADGNELYRKIGYFQPSVFIENLDEARGISPA